MHWRNKLLVLDTCIMGFSTVNLPPGPGLPTRRMSIVEAGEGRLGMFTLRVDTEYGIYDLWYTVLRNDGEGANQWQSEAIILLPLNYRYNVMGVAGGYLLLQGIPEGLYEFPLAERPNFDCFSLDRETYPA